MPTLDSEQLVNRKKVLMTMAHEIKNRCPWYTREDIAVKLTMRLERDHRELQIINALAASTTTK